MPASVPPQEEYHLSSTTPLETAVIANQKDSQSRYAPIWSLRTVKVKELKGMTKNPRRMTSEQRNHLKLSMDRFGLIDKPVVNLDNQIIGGHQRIRILKADGKKEIECWIPSQMLSEKQVEELCLRMNKNTGEWDWDSLANSFEVPDLLEWGFNVEDLGLGSDEEIKPIKKKDPDMLTCPNCGHEFED